MVIDSDRMLAIVKDLHKHLSEEVLMISFTKKDGTRRDMRCTTKLDLIPEDQHPKQKPLLNEDGSPVVQKERDPQLFSVYDLDVKGWRSFWYASIIAIRIDN